MTALPSTYCSAIHYTYTWLLRVIIVITYKFYSTWLILHKHTQTPRRTYQISQPCEPMQKVGSSSRLDIHGFTKGLKSRTSHVLVCLGLFLKKNLLTLKTLPNGLIYDRTELLLPLEFAKTYALKWMHEPM